MVDDKCGPVLGMLGRGNRSTLRKLAPQILHDLTWAHGGKPVTNHLSYGMAWPYTK
jgi:hypothetical protein